MSNYEKCLDDIKKFKGIYPYNGFNICMGDGYFLKSIYNKYPKAMINKAIKDCEAIEERIRRICEDDKN